ncbi:MAG: hypothetical protein EBV27_03890, partial [Actinobacteria bacterium]|nr:hypothetical protein [Actinomycetota bacterium]
TGTTTAPTAVGDYTITPSAVVFSSGLTSNYSISYAAGDYTISKATQSTLSLTSTSGTYGSGLTLTTSGGSGSGSITYSVTDSTATGCTITGEVLTVTSAGTCSVIVTKAADSSYNAISSSATTVNFAKANQASLTITSITGTFGSSLTLTTSGGTTAGSIVYAVSNDTALGCSITSGVLTVTQAGTCLVTATMAGSGSYETVSSNQTTITFNKAAQSDLTVTSVSGTYGTSLNLTSSGGSGTGNVTYTASTGTASSCTVSGTTLTAGSGGTCFVTASKATDTNYLVKSSNPTTVSFAKATPSLSGFNDVSKTYGDSNFTVTAPSVTGSVAGSFTYTTSNSLVADVSSTTISILSAGTATITATFNPTATDSYNSQTTTMVVTVAQKEITITAEGKTKNYGSSTPTNTYSLSTALVGSDAISSLTYTYSGTNSTSAPTNAGSYSITPSAAIFSSGDINNYDISYSPGTYTISKITPSLSGFSDISKTYGDSTFTLTAPTSSVAGSFSYATSSSSVISLSGTTATVAGAGSSTITASFTPSDSTNYNSTSTTMVITVAKASQSAVSFTSATSVNYGNTISLSATGGTGTGSISYAVASGTCTISSSTLTPGNAGSTCIITASRAADSNYLIETSEPQTITINKVTPTLSGFSNIAKTYGDNSFNLTAPTVSGSIAGTFGYVSSNLSAASVSGSTVTVNGYGSTTITATFTPSDLTNYYSTTASLVITVAKKALRVTPDNKNKNFGASHPSNSRTDTGLVGSESISTITYLYEGTGSTTYSSSSTPPTNAGTYSITPQVSALSGGDLNNYEITYDSSTLTIAKINQSSLSISSASTATYGQDLTLSTTGGSGTGSVTFAKVSGDCTLNNSGATYSITPGDAGNTCVVSATKAADNNYNVISSSNQTITITKANQTLTFTSTPSSTLINSTYTPTITSTHSISGVTTGITPTFDIANSSNSICSLTGLVITFNRAGTCEIEADAISSTNYETATTTSQIITVTNPPASSSPRNNPTPTPSASPNATQRNNPIRDVVKRIVDAIQNLPNNIPNPNSVPPINSPELRPSFPSRSDSSLPNFSNPGLAITDSLGRLPKSEPGEKQIAIEGNFLPVQEYITPQGNLGITIPQSIDAPPVEFILQTTDVQGQSIPVSDDGIIRAVKGQTIKVEGDGLAPGTEFSAWLFSDPIKLGEGKVSRDSTFEKVFIIPDGMQTGNHTLQINGMSADKKVVSLTTGVIVSEVKQIQTVSDSKTDLIGYGILIIFFLVLVIALLLRYIRKLKTNNLV